MARPIVGMIAKSQEPILACGSSQPMTRPGIDYQRAITRLRTKRSARYLAAMQRLDAGGHVADRTGIEALIQSFMQEFPELGRYYVPLGIAARCLLGSPFEVHICDFAGTIIEHFHRGRPMPATFERARVLALHPGYAFVEVYQDRLQAIGLDGSVSVIESHHHV